MLVIYYTMINGAFVSELTMEGILICIIVG